MSRIDEALQRARAKAGAASPQTLPETVPAPSPELAMFVSESADPAGTPEVSPGRAGFPDLDVLADVAAFDPIAPADVATVHPEPNPDPAPGGAFDRERPPADVRTPTFGMPAGPAVALPVEHPEWLEKLVTHRDADPATVDQYRKLAATLHHAQLERATRVVMVSSALAAEGKTLTATNLALTLCESYDRRVLLIDADLRRPTMHVMLRQPLAPGLTDVVSGVVGRKLPIMSVTPRLSALTAGSPGHDPISVLSSDRMQRLLIETSTAYDWIVIDSSPVGMLPDAHLLSSIVDVVVLVVRAGAAPYKVVQRAAETLGPDRIIGVVLNRVAAGEFHTAYPDQSYYAYSGRPQ